jgi:glycerol-3-phosphate acyltransferase PlsY
MPCSFISDTMQININIIATILLAYLTGAIPTSIWVGKVFFSLDIRDHGSGNAGASNTMRILGLKVGVPVLVFDIFKGWLAVYYARLFSVYDIGSNAFINFSILLGVLAVIGHIFPVYAQFNGGKGVATIFGVLLALHPLGTLCGGGVFLIFLWLTKYFSVGSMMAGISFPIWIILVFKSDFLYLNIFSILVAVGLLITHQKNILRLLRGEENKATFLFKTKDSSNQAI